MGVPCITLFINGTTSLRVSHYHIMPIRTTLQEDDAQTGAVALSCLVDKLDARNCVAGNVIYVASNFNLDTCLLSAPPSPHEIIVRSI